MLRKRQNVGRAKVKVTEQHSQVTAFSLSDGHCSLMVEAFLPCISNLLNNYNGSWRIGKKIKWISHSLLEKMTIRQRNNNQTHHNNSNSYKLAKSNSILKYSIRQFIGICKLFLRLTIWNRHYFISLIHSIILHPNISEFGMLLKLYGIS